MYWSIQGFPLLVIFVEVWSPAAPFPSGPWLSDGSAWSRGRVVAAVVSNSNGENHLVFPMKTWGKWGTYGENMWKICGKYVENMWKICGKYTVILGKLR